MRLRGKYGVPSNFQAAAFVANSLISGRASIQMGGLRGSRSARRKRARAQADISAISAGSGYRPRAVPRGMSNKSMSTIRLPVRKRVWNKRGSGEGIVTAPVYVINKSQRLTRKDIITMSMYPPALILAEDQDQRDFNSPFQGVYSGSIFNKGRILQCINQAARNCGIPLTSTVLEYANVFPGYGSTLPSDAQTFVGNDYNFVMKSMSVNHQLINTSTNTIEFTLQTWSNRYQVVSNASNLAITDAGYFPRTLQDLIGSDGAALTPDMGAGYGYDQNVNSGNTVSGNPATLRTYGQSIESYDAVKQYFKCCHKHKFVLKPGEQRNVKVVIRGPFHIDIKKYRMFDVYPGVGKFWSIIARAQIVGQVGTTVLSHGSGQFGHLVKESCICQYAGRSSRMTKSKVTDEFTAITEADQEVINEETNRVHVYQET